MDELQQKEEMLQAQIRILELEGMLQERSKAQMEATLQFEQTMLDYEQQTVAVQQLRKRLGLSHEEDEQEEPEEENEYGALAIAATENQVLDITAWRPEAYNISKVMDKLHNRNPEEKALFSHATKCNLRRRGYPAEEVECIFLMAKTGHEDSMNEGSEYKGKTTYDFPEYDGQYTWVEEPIKQVGRW
jgi:hypothetical protein